MKKSKMIEKMVDLIDGTRGGLNAHGLSTVLLDMMEKEGILPPPIKNPNLPKEIENEFEFAYEQALDDKYDRKAIPSPFYVNEWEKE